MPLTVCVVPDCPSKQPPCKLFKFPRTDALRALWLEFLLPIVPALGSLPKERLINYKVCRRHFEAKYIQNNRRLWNCGPTLFTSEEINSGHPSKPFPVHIKNVNPQSDHLYSRVRHFDHTYCMSKREPLRMGDSYIGPVVADPSKTEALTKPISPSNSRSNWSSSAKSDSLADFSISEDFPGDLQMFLPIENKQRDLSTGLVLNNCENNDFVLCSDVNDNLYENDQTSVVDFNKVSAFSDYLYENDQPSVIGVSYVLDLSHNLHENDQQCVIEVKEVPGFSNYLYDDDQLSVEDDNQVNEFKISANLKGPSLPQSSEAHLKLLNEFQHLDSRYWSDIRYAETQDKYNTYPGFTSLDLNEEVTAFRSPQHIDHADKAFAALTLCIFKQRDALQNICREFAQFTKEMTPLHDTINKKLFELVSDGDFQQITSDMLQMVCGHRAEMLQMRRDCVIEKAKDPIVKATLQKIPPSATNLFNAEQFTAVVEKSGGVRKCFWPLKKPNT